MIYLDNNATTAVDPRVRDAMLPYLTDFYGNPSSVHRFGQQSRQAVEHARHQLAGLIDCDVREIVFTSGGTESNNAAITGILNANSVTVQPARRTIITSSVEHAAVREPLQMLAKQGYTIREVAVDAQGHLDVEQLAAPLADPAAALVSIMWANNETGVIFDVAAIGQIARRHHVPFHVDAVQAVGKLPIHFRDLPIDLLSLSGHKFHGPKGSGALIVRRGTRWQPWIKGGPQERDRRGGTENVAGIVGLGAAAELAGAALANPAIQQHIARLRDTLEQRILAAIPDAHVNGDAALRLNNTTNIGFAALEAEAILLLLSEQDICASAGAACSSGSLEPSHVLRAMHLPERIAHGAIRFSLSRLSTEQDVDGLMSVLPTIIQRLRSVMPV